MSKTLTITEALYDRLKAAADRRGLESVEKLLESWQTDTDGHFCRHETVAKIDAIRERLSAVYGEMPDSVSLIREDRGR